MSVIIEEIRKKILDFKYVYENQIKKKFQIICDWPDKVAKYLKSDGFT